ncbi:MAG: hypothetical protein KGZ34_05040 [Nitrosarchaeum sp.]|nr:hypothetical protein [Nitrosarchaeum sp.]
MKKSAVIASVIISIIIISLVITFELNTETSNEKSSNELTFEEGEQKITSENTSTGNNFSITLTEKVGVKTP